MNTPLAFDSWSVFALVAASALLHGSFQLAVSVLTLLSGHALGAKKSHGRLLHLAYNYVFGVVLSVLVLVYTAMYLLGAFALEPRLAWALLGGLGVGVGTAVLLFYYRIGHEFMLWLPQTAAEYLYERTKKTTRGIEAFSLGIMTTVAELPFTIAPLLIVSYMLAGEPTPTRAGIGLAYTVIAAIPLVIFIALLGGGHKISMLQQWREQNKAFLQFTSGIGLIVVSIYMFVNFGIGRSI